MKIKFLRSDNGGEFLSKEFNKYCDDNGIKRHFSITKIPQQNGVEEYQNVFQEPSGVPLQFQVKHSIEHVPGSSSPNASIYRKSILENE